FFYSTRRRHTSFSPDWSSDVCSSDLHQMRQFHVAGADLTLLHGGKGRFFCVVYPRRPGELAHLVPGNLDHAAFGSEVALEDDQRSEERRRERVEMAVGDGLVVRTGRG